MTNTHNRSQWEDPFSRLTFDKANQIPWTNDLLDEAIAMNLFLLILRERKDADKFWKKKEIYSSEIISEKHKISKIYGHLYKALDSSKMGVSRKDSYLILNKVTYVQKIARVLIAPILFITNPKALISFAKDQYAQQVLFELSSYQCKYISEYLAQSLGGTWKPKLFTRLLLYPSFYISVIYTTFLLLKYPLMKFLKYLRDICHLCYDAGFNCWWVPVLLVANDQYRWSQSNHERDNNQLTSTDGILGPIFPRQILSIFGSVSF